MSDIRLNPITTLLFQYLFLISLLLVTVDLHAAPSEGINTLKSIRVVMDDNYPPYVFKDEQGQLKGIIVDQWRLWERKTGIHAEVTGMDWGEAQRRMQVGEFDVIDTIFRNEKREAIYDFTKPYARLDVPLFFHTDISGIQGAADLKGFLVAAKAGDNSIEVLKKHGVTNIVEYPSYEKLIEAAREGKAKIFTVDRPPAMYFLNKMAIQGQFRETKPLYSGEFHRAVLKGRKDLLADVEQGFDAITKSEYEALDKRWMGTTISAAPFFRYILYGAGVIAVAALLLISWLWTLRRTVSRKTSELTESEERYRSLMNNIPLGITLIDRDYRIIMVNHVQAEMLGHPVDWFKGRFCYEEFEKKEATCAHCPGATSMKTGKAVQVDTKGILDDGRQISVRIRAVPIMGANGEPTGFIEVVEDITDRKKIEQEQQLNASRLSSLYDISQYPFHDETDFLDHALSEVISLTESKIGYIYLYDEQKRQFTLNTWSKEVMKECSVVEQQSIYDLDKTGIWGEAVRQRKPILINNFEDPNPLMKGYPEGHVHLKSFLTVPVFIDGGIVAVVGVANKETDYQDADVMQLTLFMDAVWKILARKRDETERQNLEKQLLHAQKLESLGVLAGGIAHDFNNILTSIIGNADLALMRISKVSPGVDNLHKIEQAAARAADLAKQMLAYSGKGKFIVEQLDVNRLLEEMLHLLEVSISKKATLRLNLHQALPSIEGDATQLRQIIMNLVINASEAIDDSNGNITVTTGCMECDKSYLKNVWLDDNITAGHYVYLEIADTGCGMGKETLAKIFDPFFTTKFTGRGLGMAAVLGIVRGHKGSIKVYSEICKGTSFKILFPASGKPADSLNPASSLDDCKWSGTALIVDDEETVRDVGTEMLKEFGVNTLVACDGLEAIEIFRNNPDIVFVILDLTMPRMDGEQCFHELRKINPEAKIIMSSGFNEQEVTQKFVGKGLAGFIQKPYKLSALREALSKIL